MQDRPTYDELLGAIEHFLDAEIAPNVTGSRGFHARVAANAIRTIRRELASEDQLLGVEWAGLSGLLGAAEKPIGRDALRGAIRARNESLCELIRSGGADEGQIAAKVSSHVLQSVRDKISVSNPELLERSS